MEPRLQGLFKRRLLVWGLTLFSITFWACENDNQIGLDITPPGERFMYKTDSSSVIKVNTLRQDSLTSEKRERSLLGAMNDPVFGKSGAGILTQLRLSSYEVDFGNEPHLDSVVLIMKYDNGYGDTTDIQRVKVYELADSLYFDSTYYSNIDVSRFYSESDILADYEYYPTPTADSLQIRLDDRIGSKILQADENALLSNDGFLNYFKGLYLTAMPTEEDGSISYFDLGGGESKMVIYYQNSEEDSLDFEIVINSNCAYLNTFWHDYTGSEAGMVINDSTQNFGNVYIQAMAGLRAHLMIEFSDSIMKYADQGIAINKAELIIPANPNYITQYKSNPGSIQIFNANPDGTNEFIGDIFVSEDYYGGFFEKGSETYSFNIARYLQNLLDPEPDFRQENTGMFIVVKDARISANQLVLKNDPEGERIRLNITFTVIN